MICTTRYTLLVLSTQENEIGWACGSVGKKNLIGILRGSVNERSHLETPATEEGIILKHILMK